VASGRAFTRADRAGARVAVVTARSARRFWPGESAIGKRVRFVGEQDWRTIVGVLADVRAFDLEQDVPSWMDGALYVPFGPQSTVESGALPSEMALTLRTATAPATVAAALRRIAAEESRGTAVSDVVEMRTIVSDAVAAPAAMAVLAGAFALLALTLGSVGVYGVLSFAVSRLTKEIGVRVALGAQRDISWLVLSEGAKLGGAGILLGAAGAAMTMRWLASELHGVSPFDPATYALVVGLVSLVTLAACYVPARRAMRVDPLVALRD
jgi:putative ABC transport system permease protein